MFASILRYTVIVALFSSLVSASPLRRQSSTSSVTLGYFTNDATGAAWTLMFPGNASAGNLVFISPLASPPTLSQLFYQYEIVDASGTTTYQYRSADQGLNYLTFIQYTSSFNYALGYDILQTGESVADAAAFTLLPGYDAGSVYMQYQTTDGHGIEQVSWYQYINSPTNPKIPVVHDSITVAQEENQSWTWHVVASD